MVGLLHATECKTRVHRAGAPDLPSELPCCSLPQFPSERALRSGEPARFCSTSTHRAFASCSGCCAGGSHSPLLPRQGICRISFPREAQANQDPSKDLVSFTMLQKSALAFQHPPANPFRVPGLSLSHVVNPAMSNDGKCGNRLQPPEICLCRPNSPLQPPAAEWGFLPALPSASHPLPLRGPQPLGSGLPSSLAPLVQPIECSPHMPQVFRSSIHELLSSWGCSCFGSREKVGKG